MTRYGAVVRFVLLVLPLGLAFAERGLIPPTGALSNIASLVAIGALLFRRRWPVPVLVVTLIALSFTNMGVATMVALYTVAKAPGRRRSIVVVGVVTAVMLAVPWPWLDPVYLLDLSDPRNLRILLLRLALMIGGPIALGLMVQARRELAAGLAEVIRAREREGRLVADTAVARERAQLAREMHDVVAHKVGLIAVQAGALQVSAPDGGVATRAEAIRDLSAATLDELRQVVAVLRTAGSPDDGPVPRLAGIPALVRDSGIDVDLQLADAVFMTAWPDPVERAVYRTVQEGLTNARKHAADSLVRVTIDHLHGSLDVAVRSGPVTGSGPVHDLPSGGFGLIGLRERAELMQGTFVACATDDGGFLIHATYPAGV